jgi:hypothetical protein
MNDLVFIYFLVYSFELYLYRFSIYLGVKHFIDNACDDSISLQLMWTLDSIIFLFNPP